MYRNNGHVSYNPRWLCLINYKHIFILLCDTKCRAQTHIRHILRFIHNYNHNRNQSNAHRPILVNANTQIVREKKKKRPSVKMI